MTRWHGRDRPGAELPSASSGPPAGQDIVEQGGRQLPTPQWRPPRGAVLLAAAGLLAGLAGGYAAGDRHAMDSAELSRSAAAVAQAAQSAAGSLTQSGRQCSAQIGHALQLGEQVTNQSATNVTLRRVTPVLPLGGLRATAQAWAPCGALPTAQDAPDNVLPAGASGWFTVTFTVLVTCPGALPVQFTVDYDRLGRPAAVQLPGFADLGQVPYGRCPVS